MDDYFFSRRTIWVNGPIIVGAGPAGLAVAACLREQGVPFVVLEGGDCIASAWKKRTYDSPKLLIQHKQFRELPRMPFPEHYPEYPTPRQFIDYLEQYAAKFEIRPMYNTAVQAARYDETSGLWRVATASLGGVTEEFCGRWFVVATGEDAESKIPYIPGLSGFDGEVTHFSNYRSGESYRGKRVLVVGCGNSGMEVSLDLCNHGARPSLVVRDAVHVLPGEVVGKSILDLAVLLLRWLPLWLVDKILVLLAWLLLGDLTRFGFRRPTRGPLEIMDTHGSTPVLDYGAVARIRAGDIQVLPEVVRFTNDQFELIDGRAIDADAVILATGYHIAVPQWLQLLAQCNKEVFNHDGRYHNIASWKWKGQCGLYAVGFRHHDVLSAPYTDAMHIANDVGSIWREETKPTKRTGGTRRRRCSAVIF
ncbi:hypothetical protein PR202_gb27467 [Eleusine coracana subsp. coracana]|uniref:Flavin-containing monooxygenase n=1 Tax=Eleusine coracana subsp. coracana TaxID=191504 RepID=A0AAV5FRX1_ELECO|nr:hypothetical protein PR202_gb27467 [Eleusine coracana subsp. coracana]